MERTIALILLIALSPLIILLLIITILDLNCNPIFVQKRTVNGSTEFDFYKIRSMIKSAPVIPTSEFKGGDSYITPWGKILRTFSLDELLNLVNILKGDMTFIGPRPIMLCEAELVKLRLRNGIFGKPGLTGLAQINGRDKISLTRKVACERFYQSRKLSFKLRVWILLKTCYIVVRRLDITH